MPWLMRQLPGPHMLHIDAESLSDVGAAMLDQQARGRVEPGSMWAPVWLAPELDAIAVVDSQHGALIDP